MTATRLPSWRPGPVRDAVEAFLDAAVEVPIVERVACFDNDGTLWCERPSYAQFDFLVHELTQRSASDPSLAKQPEFAALLTNDKAAIGEIGLMRIAGALVGLFEGVTPEAFADSARTFMADARHAQLDRPLRTAVFQPMLELIDALRDVDFDVFVVTGGGTEFVRAISDDLYGVKPEGVVGTLIQYDYHRDDAGRPQLVRTHDIAGKVNEGEAKVGNIQTQLGRRPIFAAGNSGGDREMLEWACSGTGPSLALLVDHDDEEREFSYRSEAATFAESEAITDVAARLGWTVVSMAGDWAEVFPNGAVP